MNTRFVTDLDTVVLGISLAANQEMALLHFDLFLGCFTFSSIYFSVFDHLIFSVFYNFIFCGYYDITIVGENSLNLFLFVSYVKLMFCIQNSFMYLITSDCSSVYIYIHISQILLKI